MCGSKPRVFQTTPPQPASNARRTLYSLSVGGADASQNGFGDLMPTKSDLRSAMSVSLAIAPSGALHLSRPGPVRGRTFRGAAVGVPGQARDGVMRPAPHECLPPR